MNHLSIEGMDGIGKSTACKMLAERLNYTFVEKPLHLLFDKNENTFDEYIRIRDQVNANSDRNFTALFYGLGSLYMYDKYKNDNIITDRHLASNYAWSGTDNNDDIYELLIKKLGKPQLTAILTADNNTILNRLKTRNSNDSDIAKVDKTKVICGRMIEFCKKYELPYITIDTSNLTPEQVVESILARWNSVCRN